jgi:plasmid stability protein
MPSLAVRDIPEKSYRALVAQAKANGRSISAEVRELIDEVARERERRALIAKIKRERISDNLQIGGGLDSVALVRLIRDE